MLTPSPGPSEAQQWVGQFTVPFGSPISPGDQLTLELKDGRSKPIMVDAINYTDGPWAIDFKSAGQTT